MKEGAVIACMVVLIALFSIVSVSDESELLYQGYERGVLTQQAALVTALPETIVFGGDVLLARDVERILDQYGSLYAFSRLRDIFASAKAVVVNFEATVPEQHQPTPNMTTSFSVAAEHLPALADAGITHASLANNHTFDKGEAGYNNTVRMLTVAGMTPFGRPATSSDISITYQTVGTESLAIIALESLTAALDRSVLADLVAEVSRYSDNQIVFIHWGEEYIDRHNATQQDLAHFLIESGVDLIVGHHPHVVQDIEQYQGKLIVYSLGNLVFDQYFSEAVQEGLLLSLEYNLDRYTLTLIPVTSVLSRGVPQPMTAREGDLWLKALAARSDEAVQQAVKAGFFTLDENLAISP